MIALDRHPKELLDNAADHSLSARAFSQKTILSLNHSSERNHGEKET